MLNDIVNGTNLGCDSNGFQAVPGYVYSIVKILIDSLLICNRWDPATGLGTANYPEMKSLFLSLP